MSKTIKEKGGNFRRLNLPRLEGRKKESSQPIESEILAMLREKGLTLEKKRGVAG